MNKRFLGIICALAIISSCVLYAAGIAHHARVIQQAHHGPVDRILPVAVVAVLIEVAVVTVVRIVQHTLPLDEFLADDGIAVLPRPGAAADPHVGIAQLA